MAYTDTNFKTKKALKEAVAAGKKISVFSPGLGGPYNGRSNVGLEGPHSPAPHTWYATADVDANGYIVKVK
jgi:hypothetical protein